MGGRFGRAGAVALACAALGLLACGGSSDDGAADASLDPAVAADPGLGEVVADAPPADEAGADIAPGACQPAQPGAAGFPLFPDLPDTQIHAVAAFDGEALWLAFDVPRSDGSGAFETWAARLRCDGTFAVAPFRVGTVTRGNEIEPDLAIRDGRVFIAWEVDTGGDPNLFIVYRMFQADGTPLMTQDRLLPMTVGGKTFAASAWMPKVAALPSGAFALSGSWADPQAKGFQAFVARVDAEGTAGDLIPVYGDLEASQVYPAIAADDDGRLFVAWAREVADADDRVYFTSFAPGGAVGDAPVPGSPATASAGAALATAPGAKGQALVAFGAGGTDSDIVVRAALPADDTSPRAVFGAKNQVDHTPTVVAVDGGGAVAWFRIRAGIRDDVLIQAFAFDGPSLKKVRAETLLNPAETGNDHAAGPYQAAMTPVGGGLYFLAWSEGVSPAFRLVGRFVKP